MYVCPVTEFVSEIARGLPDNLKMTGGPISPIDYAWFSMYGIDTETFESSLLSLCHLSKLSNPI